MQLSTFNHTYSFLKCQLHVEIKLSCLGVHAQSSPDYIIVIVAIQVFSSYIVIHYNLSCKIHGNITHCYVGGINTALHISVTVAETQYATQKTRMPTANLSGTGQGPILGTYVQEECYYYKQTVCQVMLVNHLTSINLWRTLTFQSKCY